MVPVMFSSLPMNRRRIARSWQPGEAGFTAPDQSPTVGRHAIGDQRANRLGGIAEFGQYRPAIAAQRRRAAADR